MFFFFDFDNHEMPSLEQMVRAVLMALSQLGGSASIKELDEKAIEIMKIPDDMKTLLHKGSSNRTEVAYRLAWARTYLKKYGLIKNESRGYWAFSDKYQGKPEEIDVNEIVHTVRKGGNEEKEEDSLSPIGSYQAFENLVISILRDKVKTQNKTMDFMYSDTVDFGYDLELPEGIDDYEQPVYCILKYVPSGNVSVSIIVRELLKDLHKRVKDGTLLIIINTMVAQKEKIETIISEEYGITVVIWGQEELFKMTDPESDYANYLVDPKKALIEETLQSHVTAEERERKKREYIGRMKAAYRKQDVFLFLGAGVSADAGIPKWPEMIRQMLIHMINTKTKGEKLSSEDQDMLNKVAYDNKEDSPLTQMRYIRSAFTDEEYYRIVHEILYAKEQSIDTDLLGAIAKISRPQRSYNGIKGIVTYNFDDLLERKFKKGEIAYHTICRESDISVVDKLNIHHVHGYLPNDLGSLKGTPNLVFSEEDYHKVYRDAYSWSNLTQLNAFRESTCVFIGCSLTDPNLRRLLDVASRSGEIPRHYAFLKRKTFPGLNEGEHNKKLLELYTEIDDNIREGYFKELGINIVWVDKFEEIPVILQGFLE